MGRAIENNKVYKYLDEKRSSYIYKINELYDVCDKILGQIPAYFSNYTLHDIGHATRVIEHGTDFLDKDLSVYSDLHLALIFYAGLLHDIGMFVSDEKHDDIESMLSESNADFATFSKKEKDNMIQDYVRKRHGQRIAEVIEESEEIKRICNSTFTYDESYSLLDIVLKICESHNQESFCEWITDELESDYIFGNEAINPMHIGILLRLGDNLDIDQQRAPIFLADLLHVKGYSKGEWGKHIPVTNYRKVCFEDEKPYIHFDGRTSEPDMYKKVEDHILWLKEEVGRINDVIATFEAPYNISIDGHIRDKIKTEGFEKNDYRFTLDYDKISKLLMGEHIYEDKKAGIRELLQNSIDAVLTMKDIKARDKSVISSYVPTIVIDFDDSKNEISISDNGTGMNHTILKNHFFNLGSSYYTSSAFAKKECKYKPIGHFGIGFMACFMLSDKVTLITKHYEGADASKIEFEKDCSYTITRKLKKGEYGEDHGTKIILQYDKIIPDIFEDSDKVCSYVRSLLLPGKYHVIFKKAGNVIDEIKNGFSPKPYFCEDADMELSFNVKLLPDIIESCDGIVNAEQGEKGFFVNTELAYEEDLWGSSCLIDDMSSALEEMPEKFITIGIGCSIQSDEERNNAFSSTTPEVVKNTIETLLLKSDISLKSVESMTELAHKAVLKSCCSDDHLTVVRVSYIAESNKLKSYLENKENDSESARKLYKSAFRSFVLFGVRKEQLSDEQIISFVNEVVASEKGDADYGEFAQYPLEVEEIKQRVIADLENSIYLPIEEKKTIYDKSARMGGSLAKLYVRGIRIKTAPITIPVSISGFVLGPMIINMIGNEYELDVSRSHLTQKGQAELAKNLARRMFSMMLQKNEADLFSPSEVKLWNEFMRIYYPE